MFERWEFGDSTSIYTLSIWKTLKNFLQQVFRGAVWNCCFSFFIFVCLPRRRKISPKISSLNLKFLLGYLWRKTTSYYWYCHLDVWRILMYAIHIHIYIIRVYTTHKCTYVCGMYPIISCKIIILLYFAISEFRIVSKYFSCPSDLQYIIL